MRKSDKSNGKQPSQRKPESAKRVSAETRASWLQCLDYPDIASAVERLTVPHPHVPMHRVVLAALRWWDGAMDESRADRLAIAMGINSEALTDCENILFTDNDGSQSVEISMKPEAAKVLQESGVISGVK
jgi:hypothetical protein